MEIQPEVYSKLNSLQTNHGELLITRILEDNPNRKCPLILDVGCGSSNVTRILGVIPHQKIFAIDIDPDMIKFANNNKSISNSIEFIVEDISKPWELLHKQLTELEGQFDLIFSNLVWHWIHDYPQASSNVARLLKPGGLLYFNIAPAKPIFDWLSRREKEQMERYVKIKPQEIQRKDWVAALEKSGVRVEGSKLEQCEWDFKDSGKLEKFMGLIRHYHLIFMTGATFQSEEEREAVVKYVENLVDKAHSVPTGMAWKNMLDPENCQYYFDVLLIHGRKNGIPN